jgi:hypothetical protein
VKTAVRLSWMLAALLAAQAPATAQGDMPLTDKDRAEIQAMSVRYRLALFGCKGQDYADLFATPGGYFASSSRGEVRERQALIEMVSGYERCSPPPTPAQIDREAPPVAGAPGSPFPAPKIEASPEGARARIVNSKGGGYYDDVYVRTPKGWRFRSRNVVSDAELAAGLTTEDFIAIRALAGDDHGYYEDLYGKTEQEMGPRANGADKRPFRASGLRLTAVPGGVKGIAYLRNNGGRYEDMYVKTPAGWRIKERNYVPPAPR